MRAIGVWAALGALAMGCRVEPGAGRFPPQEVADVGGAGGDTSDIGGGVGPGTLTMDGTWLVIHESSTCIEFIGVEESVNLAMILVEIEQEGQRLHETRNMCMLDLTPLFGLRLVMPQIALETTNPMQVGDSYVSHVGIGGGYASGIEQQFFGLRPHDILTVPVPESLDDPMIFDADEDGRPGITMVVEGGLCEMHAVQRAATRYMGAFTTPNQIDGGSVTLSTNQIYETTSPLCGAATQVTPNDAFSAFRMLRVDGRGGAIDLDIDANGQVSCDEVRQAAPTLWTKRDTDRGNCTAR